MSVDTTELRRAAKQVYPVMPPADAACIAWLLAVAADEIDRLCDLLVEAAGAFVDCTGDYARELVAGEAWAEAAVELSPTLAEALSPEQTITDEAPL